MIAVLLVLIALASSSDAQIEIMSSYVFPQDSVAGFDEQSASLEARAENFYGLEYKVFIYRSKRAFIKQKYQLKITNPRTLFQSVPFSRLTTVNGGECNNEDFELATSNIVAPNSVQGWSVQSGNSSNSCNPPNLNAVNLYTVYFGTISDTRMPGTISSYFDASSNTTPSGNAFIRLNNDLAGAKAVRLTKTFIPTATSALFQYAYIAVIEDGSHSCCTQAGFNIKITVTNTVTNTSTLLACPNISVAVPGSACSFSIPPGGPVFSPCIGAQGAGWSYSNWTSSALDLTQYINNLVQLDITVVDCSAGGHGAYFYFDAKCSSMSITGNGTPFPAGTPSVTLPTCGATGATICATPGLGPYSWAGQGVPSNYSTPSMTNQCFTSSLSTTYTLYMNPPGSCAPIARVINTTITPAPLLLANIVQATCGGSLAVITLTPSGSAANPSSIVWSPTPLSLNSQTTVGTYTVPTLSNTVVVSVTAKDPLGCLVTQTLGVLPAAPDPTFAIVNTTGSQSITCTNPSINLDAQTSYTYGTLNYFWASNSATFASNPITINTSATYTCVIKDPVTNCNVTHTVFIGLNTVAPLSTISPTMQNINCSFPTPVTVTATATPSINVTHNILSPYGGTVSAASHTMIYVPSCGVYTYVIVNDVNGCSSTRQFSVACSQGFPTFSVTSPQNFTLGCTSTSCAILSIEQGNTDPSGGAVSYTVLNPGSSSVTAPGPLSGSNLYTVCAPGTYIVITKDNSTGCETRVPVSVLQNTFTPNLNAIVDRQILDCDHPNVTLRGTSTTNGVGYLWNFVGNPNSQQGDTIFVSKNSGALTNTVVNTFTLTITNMHSTCKSTSVIPIYQNLFPPKAMVTIGQKYLTCLTTSVVLTNQSSSSIPPLSGLSYSYPVVSSWQGPSPQVPKINASTYTAAVAGIYTMTAKDLNNGCTSFTTLALLDNRSYPILNNPISPPTTSVDCGDIQTPLYPFITGEASATVGLTYQWLTPPGTTIGGLNSLTLSVKDAGEYSIIVTNTVNGCVSRTNMEVLNGKLVADFEPDQITGFAPLKVNFENNSFSSNPITGKTKINSVWNFGNGTSKTYTSVESASTVFNQPGSYTVTLYVTKGTCLDNKQKVVVVDIASSLKTPNVFTPNGDGVNDLFFLKATNLIEINIHIFDRWGILVYEVVSDKGNVVWDGKNMLGKDAAEGTYFYTLKATGKDSQEFNENGTINLFR